MAELFKTIPDIVGLHLNNIYVEGQLAESATAEDFSVVQNEDGRAVWRTLTHYSLDAIIAIGYRMLTFASSRQATCCGKTYFIHRTVCGEYAAYSPQYLR